MSLKAKGILYTILAWLLIAALIGLLLFALSPLLEVGYIRLWRAIPPITHVNIIEYTSGEFAERKGGDHARKALPSVEELGNYEKIGYCYFNYKFQRFATSANLSDVWILDVQYAEEDFKEACYQAYCRYAEGTDEEKRNAFEEDFSKGEIFTRKSYDEGVFASIELIVDDTNQCVIRYLYTSNGDDYGTYMQLTYWGGYPEIGSLWEE